MCLLVARVAPKKKLSQMKWFCVYTVIGTLTSEVWYKTGKLQLKKKPNKIPSLS